MQLIDRARAIAAAGLLLAFLPGAATAEAVRDLYQGSTLVTGQVEATRVPGFGRCLRDVLVKVSGDLRLLHDARLDALEKEAARFVRGFAIAISSRESRSTTSRARATGRTS